MLSPSDRNPSLSTSYLARCCYWVINGLRCRRGSSMAVSLSVAGWSREPLLLKDASSGSGAQQRASFAIAGSGCASLVCHHSFKCRPQTQCALKHLACQHVQFLVLSEACRGTGAGSSRGSGSTTTAIGQSSTAIGIATEVTQATAATRATMMSGSGCGDTGGSSNTARAQSRQGSVPI